tara:strand:- start:32 stop:268 length:237 start_codon:yes stop_codon:yes gene_type:complete
MGISAQADFTMISSSNFLVKKLNLESFFTGCKRKPDWVSGKLILGNAGVIGFPGKCPSKISWLGLSSICQPVFDVFLF